MKRWKLILTLVLCAAGVGLYFGLRPGPEADAPPSKEEALRVEVKKQDLLIEVIDSGKIEPIHRIEVKSKVPGQVARLWVVEGQVVSRGQLLLTLESTDFEREVAMAQADLAQATNELALAGLEFDRKQEAAKERAISGAELDLARHQVIAKKIAQDRAQIGLSTARDQLRYTRIEAPIAGTVLELGIKEGEVVTPGVQQTFEGRPLLVIGDLSRLLVKAELNQIDVAQVALEQEVSLTLDALPGRTFSAKVHKIAPSSVRPKGKDHEVFPVEATLTEVDPAIRPGMTADLRFRIALHPAVMAVPIEAVLRETEGAFVQKIVAAEGKERLVRSKVELGARNDRQLEVIAGVSEGELLLIQPGSAKDNEVEL
ncbi:MAG: efflux RND transporter periplasmic adaptor subunit [Deltaproteobacteria bacterium]|nr:efflux RND transporter periplasmic adaptor subunit [Deltaproteobacteria bacterium]